MKSRTPSLRGGRNGRLAFDSNHWDFGYWGWDEVIFPTYEKQQKQTPVTLEPLVGTLSILKFIFAKSSIARWQMHSCTICAKHLLENAMHRREFITLFGGAAVVLPLAQRARQPGTVIMRSLVLIVVTLLVVLHPSTVAYTQDAHDAAEIVSSGTEIPLLDCRPGITSRSWAVITEKPSGTAIKHTHMASAEEAETLAICESAAPKNSGFSLRLKVLHGGRGGVAFRIATPKVYYLVEIDVLRDRASLLLVNNGTEEEIVAVDADVAVNTWHTLAIRAQDDRFTIYLNGIWIFTGYDKTLVSIGVQI
jgi:hypothetical protein